MRKLIPILILLVCAAECQAQNWNPLNPGVRNYFTNVTGYLRGMEIDSIQGYGNDVHYYPFLRVHNNSAGYSTTNSFDPDTMGSWLGRDVIRKPGGTFLIPNHWHDTITIRTSAMPGDSWVFFQRSPDKYYLAEVTSAGMLNVLGTTDSVKRITLRAYENGNINTADSFDNAEIVLSKSHGFHTVMELYFFPFSVPDTDLAVDDYYLANSLRMPDEIVNTPPIPGKHHAMFSLINYHEPTRAEFINWEVGDVYEYDACFIGVATAAGHCDPPYNYRVDTVISKTLTNSRVTYVRQGWQARAVYVTNSSSISHYDMLPHRDTVFYSNNILYDSDGSVPERWQVYYFNTPATLIYFDPFDTSSCTTSPACYKQAYRNGLGGGSHFSVYKQGIGLTGSTSYSSNDFPLFGHNNLIYSLRNGVSCGSYLFPDTSAPVVNSVVEVGAASFCIFPNPAQEQVNIETRASAYSLVISNNIGQVVYRKEPSAGKQVVDTRQFTDGVYVIRLEMAEGGVLNQKLVVRH